VNPALFAIGRAMEGIKLQSYFLTFYVGAISTMLGIAKAPANQKRVKI